MSDEPPIDETGLEDAVERLDAALSEAGVTDPALKEALAASLRAALGRLGELGKVDLTVDVVHPGEDDHGGPPEVTVVDGGRQRGQPRVQRPRPTLRVAQGDEDGPEERRPFALFGRTLRLGREGTVKLPADGRQAIYRGGPPHPYRVLCAEGALSISVDGVTIETLEAGQSMDVEGTVIVALAAEAPAAGRYTRL